MKKNVGILTFHTAENYGAVLQAYALLTSLQAVISDVNFSVVDYCPKAIKSSYEIFISVKSAKSIVKKMAHFVLCIVRLPETLKRKHNFRTFRNTYLDINTNWKSTEYDCVICGSDQIWNPSLTNGVDTTYFADFCDKKIGYAVSDGGECILNKDVVQFINNFSALSVREKTLENRIKRVIEKDICTVLDPVFLISKDTWYQKINSISVNDTNYILVYCLHSSKEFDKLMNELSLKLGRKIVVITYARSVHTYFDNTNIYRTAVTPFEFLSYIYEADFVFTNSFHCTAFSIIFQKSFFVPFLPKRADRIVDMLQLFGLSDRYIQKLPESKDKYMLHYTTFILEKIENEIQKSKQFLFDALKVTECI